MIMKTVKWGVSVLLGITGPSGAGKGCVAKIFAQRGFAVIDADQVARDVVLPGQPVLAALADRFGGDIIKADGTLDRRLLAQRAFSSQEETEALNGIMHGEICRRMKALAENYKKSGQNCLFDAPLLIEAGLTELCDRCIAVISSEDVRIARLMERDGISQQEIHNRLSRQQSDGYYISHCDYTVYNDGDLRRVEEQVKTVADSLADDAST